MTTEEILQSFCKLLQQKRVRYLLTGGFAAGYYGFPRATHDIDFLVEVEEESMQRLRSALIGLGKSYLVNLHELAKEVKAPTIVTVFHFKTSLKIDFWIVNSKNFSHEWMRRKERLLYNQKIFLVSPEDLILTKLSWHKEVPSERHFRDCVGIWKVQKGHLDLVYLRKSAKELGISLLLTEVSKADY